MPPLKALSSASSPKHRPCRYRAVALVRVTHPGADCTWAPRRPMQHSKHARSPDIQMYGHRRPHCLQTWLSPILAVAPTQHPPRVVGSSTSPQARARHNRPHLPAATPKARRFTRGEHDRGHIGTQATCPRQPMPRNTWANKQQRAALCNLGESRELEAPSLALSHCLKTPPASQHKHETNNIAMGL